MRATVWEHEGEMRALTLHELYPNGMIITNRKCRCKGCNKTIPSKSPKFYIYAMEHYGRKGIRYNRKYFCHKCCDIQIEWEVKMMRQWMRETKKNLRKFTPKKRSLTKEKMKEMELLEEI